MRTATQLRDARVVAILGHSADIVAPALHDYPVEAVVNEPLLGPVHALTALTGYLDNRQAPVVVFPSDVPLLSPATLARLLTAHAATNAAMTLVTGVAARAYGLMRILRDERDEVVGVVGERDASRQQRSIRECTSGVFAINAGSLKAALETFSWDDVAGNGQSATWWRPCGDSASA